MQRRPDDDKLALPALALGALGIAFAPIFAKQAVNVDQVEGAAMLSPVAVAFWRMALAAPFFIVALWRQGAPATPPAREAWRLALPGVFFAADLGLWHWAFEYTSVANATLEANFAVVFVAVLSWLWLKETMRPIFWVGAALALAGMTQLVGFSLSLGGDQWIGDLMGLGTAVAYTGYLIATKLLVSSRPVALVMAWTCVSCAVCLIVGAALTPGRIVPQTAAGWANVVALALVSQVAGQGLIAYGMSRLPASLSAVTLILQPLLAAGLGWIMLGQALTGDQIIAGAVVLAGIVMAKQGSGGVPAAQEAKAA